MSKKQETQFDPDKLPPWPKYKDGKRRLVTWERLEEAKERLAPGEYERLIEKKKEIESKR